MMRKFMLLFLALAVSVFLASPAYAQARFGLHVSQPIESTGIATDADGVTMDYGVWVYGIRIFADASNSFMGIYNADVVATDLTKANCKDEIGEATQHDTAERFYDKPMYFSDGVGIVISTGVGWVIYGSAPN